MVVLMVRRGTKGFSLGGHEDKLGQRVCPASTLTFENCFVPDDQVLMDQHTIAEFTDDPVRDVMVRHFDFWLCLSRAAIAAWGVAAARGAYEIALDHANKNELDGKPMIRHEWVQCRLTEMYANARVGRLTYLDALAANPLYALLESKPVYYAMKFTPRAVFRRVLGPLLDRRATTRLTSKVLLGRRFDQSLCVGLSSMVEVHRERARSEELSAGARAHGCRRNPARPTGGEDPSRRQAASDLRRNDTAQSSGHV
jgi:acyl-CoA dehydrogenase